MSAQSVLARAGKAIVGVAVVILLVVIGKVEYAMVERLGPRLGFDGAALLAMGAYVLALLALRSWWRRRQGASFILR